MSENVTNTAATASDQATAPTIEIAAHAGTCYGVQRALDMALAAAPQAGECTQVHTLGPLIHNPIVVRELAEAGVGLAENLDDAASGTVIIRAHGVVPQVIDAARERGLTVVDATCPYVKKVHVAAERLVREGYRVVVVGEPGHPEVEGILGHAGNDAQVVSCAADANALSLKGKVGLVVQTTQTAQNLAEVVAAITPRVQELRVKMRALGNVNLDAVDEFQRVQERYSFLREQKNDLETAQTDLRKVIEQLTVSMKEIFASEFAKLNVYFRDTFREIFGGGHAELQLADTSDILNCGIDIRVSPPGKAVKTITLLSGGEKAFVAIALYFAILKLRPTPFCVLDEIEAALDDVNVQRFAKYIRRLTDSTQFIVITHRRGTMEEADMLYGVTMQEQGVSKMLMLNLAEAEKRLKNTIK